MGRSGADGVRGKLVDDLTEDGTADADLLQGGRRDLVVDHGAQQADERGQLAGGLVVGERLGGGDVEGRRPAVSAAAPVGGQVGVASHASACAAIHCTFACSNSSA